MTETQSDTKKSPQRLQNLEELKAPFEESYKGRDLFRVGTEWEKTAVHKDLSAVPFEGGIDRLLSLLQKDEGWAPHQEYEGGPVISLEKDGASITLEPGGQVELSGAPLRTIHQTHAEFSLHVEELERTGEQLGFTWYALGFHPLAKRSELPWTPKLRYGVMREYLPTRGSRGLDMMLRTCTVQSNLDYENENDGLRKLRVGLRLQPLVTAIFANSPWLEGKRAQSENGTPLLSERAKVWLDVDPDRSGLLPFAWDEKELTLDRYIQWALDAPMFLVKRGNDVIKNTGQTFRSFFEDGYQGTFPNQEDWVTHVNTLFPEVRLKRTLEMRGADGAPLSLVVALSALWKGLMYDDTALKLAEDLSYRYSFEEAENARPLIAEKGLRASIGKQSAQRLAEELSNIASDGLIRLGKIDARNLNDRGENESKYMKPLHSLITKGLTPAEAILEASGGDIAKASGLRWNEVLSPIQ